MEDAARALRNARIRAGLTQRQLADRAGTSQPAVNRYELGRVRPRADVLQRLLAACVTRPAPDVPGAAHPPFLGPVGYLLARRRDDVVRVAVANGASDVRVFGTVVRAEDVEDSDLELLVDLVSDEPIRDLARLSAELSDVLGVHVRVETPDIIRSHVRRRALLEARRL